MTTASGDTVGAAGWLIAVLLAIFLIVLLLPATRNACLRQAGEPRVSGDNPYEPPAAPGGRPAAGRPQRCCRALQRSLALLFAGGVLAVLMLEIASAPAPVRLIEHVDMLAVVLAAVLVGLGLWRHSPWGWWIGLLGGGAVLVQLALRVKREGQLAPGPGLWFSGVMAVAFLAVLLLPRTIRAFTR